MVLILPYLSDEWKQQGGHHQYQSPDCVRKKLIVTSPPHIKASCLEQINHVRNHLKCMCVHADFHSD